MKGCRILIVVTSHDRMGFTAEQTGLWLDEFTVPYYRFLAAGATVRVASPGGGAVPIDPRSVTAKMLGAESKRFFHSGDRILDFSHRLSDMDDHAFDAVFYPGGHGPMWDLAADRRNARLVSRFYETGRMIGTVCHGTAALLKARRSDGYPVIFGRKITGFSNAEEQELNLERIVPFLLETRLVELGALYSRGVNWRPHVVMDGNIISGQNPKSAAGVAEAMICHWKRGAEPRWPAIRVSIGALSCFAQPVAKS